MRTSRFALTLALFVGLVLPSVAHACLCMDGGDVLPPTGIVPPNVIFHVRGAGKGPLVLIDENGARVPMREELIGDGLVRLSPSSPLEDGKQYTLEMTRAPDPLRGYRYGSYTVAGQPDVKPPSAPSETRLDYVHNKGDLQWNDTCHDEEEGYTVLAVGAVDDQASAEHLGYLVVSASAPEQVLGIIMPFSEFIGTTTCMSSFDVKKWGGTQVALRSVDRAGNPSAPGPAVKLTKSMPYVAALLLHTTLGRSFLVIVVTVLLGLILLVARGSLRERQP